MTLPTDKGMISLSSPQSELCLPWRQGTWWAPRRLWWDGVLGAPHTSWENTPVIQAGSGPLLLEPGKDKDRWQWQQSSDRDSRIITSVCQELCHTLFALILTLSDEQVVTREAAMMKSRISIVAPGRPILKNLGLQCFMIVFTMSCRNHTVLF